MTKAVRTNTRRKKRSKSKVPTDSINDLVGFIPEGKTLEISDSFLDYVSLIYGESGSGKTSLCSKIPGAYIIQCDPKRKGLKVRQTNIPSNSLSVMQSNKKAHTPWAVIIATVDAILKSDSVKVVVIDNFRNFYDHASNHYCLGEGVNGLNEMNDYGTSWNNVDAMYMNLLQKIDDSGRGIIIISHQKTREIELPDRTYDQIQPDVTGRPFQAIRAITDFCFYLGFDSKGGRVMTIRHKGNDIWYKCCTDESEPRFYDPDGQPIHQIAMGSTPQQSWDNLMLSWDNKLFDISHKPEKKKKKVKKRR